MWRSNICSHCVCYGSHTNWFEGLKTRFQFLSRKEHWHSSSNKSFLAFDTLLLCSGDIGNHVRVHTLWEFTPLYVTEKATNGMYMFNVTSCDTQERLWVSPAYCCYFHVSLPQDVNNACLCCQICPFPFLCLSFKFKEMHIHTNNTILITTIHKHANR